MDNRQQGNQQKERIAGLYQRVAARYGQIGPDLFSYVGEHLVERIGLSEGARVLDVAAGRGANLFAAARKVGPRGEVIGIDLAAGMVQETTAEIARRQLRNVRMFQMDAEALAFPDASFDALLCGFAIFLFPHLERTLVEFSRVLRPGGRLGISVARDLSPFARWYGEHITSYHQRYAIPLAAGGGKGREYAELPHYLSEAGFADVQLLQEQADFVYANAQEWWDSRWTHGPRFALEHMEPKILTRFKAEVLARLAQEEQQDGLHESMLVSYFLATNAK
ncbi:methyltransferase domain-containing protein [Ktedonosporobacter rubrisoli]|uniref:methyltransferase domain-containing protein n=1 Tax=Ktedonosporobacter rubrisoli TaxID=2509675 RepID=UPI0013EEC4B6|nr:methyltransferase domain-containing protein [Ktedonosporobacter rubrisoli]